jgi:hypothetical protein
MLLGEKKFEPINSSYHQDESSKRRKIDIKKPNVKELVLSGTSFIDKYKFEKINHVYFKNIYTLSDEIINEILKLNYSKISFHFEFLHYDDIKYLQKFEKIHYLHFSNIGFIELFFDILQKIKINELSISFQNDGIKNSKNSTTYLKKLDDNVNFIDIKYSRFFSKNDIMGLKKLKKLKIKSLYIDLEEKFPCFNFNTKCHEITDDYMAEMMTLSIKKLVLNGCKSLKSKGFSFIGKMKSLISLEIIKTEIVYDNCLIHLKDLKLTDLTIDCRNITNKSFTKLTNMSLICLSIFYMKINNNTYSDILLFEKLAYLNLCGCRVRRGIFGKISKIPSIKKIITSNPSYVNYDRIKIKYDSDFEHIFCESKSHKSISEPIDIPFLPKKNYQITHKLY